MKNLPKTKTKGKKQKKVKVLVSHPVIPKQYPKATTVAEKKLTKDVKAVISGSRKALDKENNMVGSPAAKDHLDKKKRELQYFSSTAKQNINNKKGQGQLIIQNDKNIHKLKKLLKWKESNLKRQQREVQQNLEMKVQLKK